MAASSNNALIGALRVEATLDAGKFVDGARKIQKESKQTETTVKSSFASMGSALKAGIAGFVGTLTVGYFTNIVRAALQYAGSLGEVAQQLGVTTRDLQTFRFMAGQVGVSQEQLETGLSKLTITLGKVAAGAQEPAKALKAIGLSAKDVANIDTGEAFRKIADGLSKVQDRSQRAAVEVALFGKSGAMLDNMLSGGSAQIDALSAAAEKLGIVLSDEQIRRADDTADKLEALKTVLSANIAGVVADNADSIYRFADSLAHLIAQLPAAITQLKSFYAQFLNFSANVTEGVDTAVEHPLNRFNPLTMGIRGGQFHANRLATIKADRAEANAINQEISLARVRAIPILPPELSRGARSTGSIPQFLAPKSSPKKAPTAPLDRTSDTAAEFAQEQRQADMDILRAKQQLAGSAEQRAALELQLIQLEHDTQAAEIDEKVRRARQDVANAKDAAEKKIAESVLQETVAQSAILKAKNDEATAIKLRAFAEEKLTQHEQDLQALTQQDLKFRIESLHAADDAATTQADRRRIQLAILDAEYEARRLELENNKNLAIRNHATADQIKLIQDQLDNLANEKANDRAGVMRNTQSPLEQWAQDVPKTLGEINEAFQKVQVEGIEGLADAMVDVIQGTKSLGQAFTQLANQIAADILRMTLRMLFFRAISSLGGLGGGFDTASFNSTVASNSAALGVAMPGFRASGGPVQAGQPYVVGERGPEIFMPSFSGSIIPNNRLSAAGMSGSMPPPVQIVTHIDATGADPAELSRVRAAVNQLNQELPYRVVQAWYDARSRNVIR